MCQPIQIPRYVPVPSGPILQVESLIFGLRRQGVPEDQLERLREENKYTPPPPAPVRLKKKKKTTLIGDIKPIFATPVVTKKKVLKAVVKKI